jgi:hypothetical protein
MNSFFQRISERAPWFLLGACIALFWFLGFGYLSMIFSVLPMWGGEVPRYYVFLYPSFSIVPLALVLSLFRKHNVVSGILFVAILFTVYAGVQTKKLADYSIARSGRSFYSALKEHFFGDTRLQ